MDKRLYKRMIARQKPKDFAAAADSRRKKPRPTLASATQDTTTDFFSLINHNAQMLLFLGLVLAGIQLAIQLFYWANERVWKSYSALKLLKRFQFTPSHPGLAEVLDLVSAGVAISAAAFAVMLVTQIFIKRGSR